MEFLMKFLKSFLGEWIQPHFIKPSIKCSSKSFERLSEYIFERFSECIYLPTRFEEKKSEEKKWKTVIITQQLLMFWYPKNVQVCKWY